MNSQCQSGSPQEVFDSPNDDLNDDLNDDSNDDLNDDLGESSSEEIDPKAAAEILEKLENEVATLRKETSQIREEIHALDAKQYATEPKQQCKAPPPPIARPAANERSCLRPDRGLPRALGEPLPGVARSADAPAGRADRRRQRSLSDDHQATGGCAGHVSVPDGRLAVSGCGRNTAFHYVGLRQSGSQPLRRPGRRPARGRQRQRLELLGPGSHPPQHLALSVAAESHAR